MKRAEEVDASLRGQAEIWKHISSGVVSLALNCAVELRIADIIHSNGGPMTLSQIASKIPDATSPNISYLERIMRLLVHKNIFTTHHDHDDKLDGGETLYGLTALSKWILWDSSPTLVSFVRIRNHPLLLAPWQCLSQCVKDGDVMPWKKAYGSDSNFWDFTSANNELSDMMTHAMLNTVDTELAAFLEIYKDGLKSIGSLVDVGGRTGRETYEIVKSYPHIIGINFELPDVIAKANVYDGVANVGGDMFEAIPNADAVLLKGILRDWPDEMCVKILENCWKAIPEKSGKVIVLDIILELGNNHVFEESHLISDLTMMVYNGGRERTEVEWMNLLKEGGFPRCKIIKMPARLSIIEAYPI